MIARRSSMGKWVRICLEVTIARVPWHYFENRSPILGCICDFASRHLHTTNRAHSCLHFYRMTNWRLLRFTCIRLQIYRMFCRISRRDRCVINVAINSGSTACIYLCTLPLPITPGFEALGLMFYILCTCMYCVVQVIVYTVM